MNQVNLVGRLTRDIELQTTSSKIKYIRNTVAVNRNFINNQTGNYDADFINIVAWRNNAEFINNHVQKGTLVAITGSLQSSTYTNREGNVVSSMDVVVNNINVLETKTAIQARFNKTTNTRTYNPNPKPSNETTFAVELNDDFSLED